MSYKEENTVVFIIKNGVILILGASPTIKSHLMVAVVVVTVMVVVAVAVAVAMAVTIVVAMVVALAVTVACF